MTAIKDLTDVISLEVEQQTTGLRNLLANPSGDLGGWAWGTSVGIMTSGSDAGGPYLEFQTDAYMQGPYTEQFPVDPGEYVAASFYVVSTEVYWTAQVRFWDDTGHWITMGPQIAISNVAGQRFSVPPALAPAGTVAADILFTPYATSAGTTAPLAGKKVRMRQVVASKAATAAALGPVYTNRVGNPSFEVNTTGWAVTGTGSAVARVADTLGGSTGSWMLQATKGAGVSSWTLNSPEYAVTGGVTYSARVRTRYSMGPVNLKWYTSAHALISSSPLSWIQNGEDPISDPPIWVGGNVTAPPTAAYVRLYVGATTAGTIQIGAWSLVDAPDVTYFDGATPDATGIDYSWTGTAGLSTSTKSLSNLPYIAPITYQQIIGSAVSIGVQRRTFDGTLSVTIRDAELDPATATLIRPGRACRLSAKTTAGAWEVIFQGTVQRPSVDYGDLKRQARPTITLTAYGPGADLAGTPSKDGVSGIPNIPALMEGVRVPFKVDGSTSQVPYTSAPIVSSNDQASVLDQVILTRDSAQGYAWLTRKGVLQAQTDRTLDYYGTGVATFAEADYTSLALSYDPDAVINQVTVILLGYNASTGDTEETTYGPYTDRASYREWGPAPAEFRVHGAVNPATFAASVLAANATATQRVEKLRVPITDTDQITPTRALIDIMAKAHVSNVDRAIALDLRVQGVDHTITWTKGQRPRWYMDLLFTGEDQVAAPIAIPPAGASGIQEGVWTTATLASPFTSLGGSQVPMFMRKNGITYIRGGVNRNSAASGSVVFTLPAGYRPAQNWQYVNDSTPASTTSIRLVAGGDGTVKIFEKVAGYTIGYLGTSFPAEQ